MKLSQGTDMTHGNQPISIRVRAAGAVLGTVLPCLAAAVARAGELTIEVSGITPNRGQVYIAVYDRAEAFPIAGRQRVSQVLASEDQHLTVHFKDLPPGQYAAAAFQDSNGNGKLDKNLFGIPKEPYGFSNSARGSTGPPKFADAAIVLNPDAATTIVLK
jgi:uncharacterized protein (DUF2141 family)